MACSNDQLLLLRLVIAGMRSYVLLYNYYAYNLSPFMIYLDPGVSCRGSGFFCDRPQDTLQNREADTFMEFVWALLLMTSPILICAERLWRRPQASSCSATEVYNCFIGYCFCRVYSEGVFCCLFCSTQERFVCSER